jgi:hypothetical protein
MFADQAVWFMLISLGIAVVNLLLGLFGVKLNAFSIVATGAVELLLLGQLVLAIVRLVQGDSPKGNVFEFFGYVVVALAVPAVATLLAFAEKSKNATLILALSAFTVSVMLLRMWVIWNGQ